MNWFKRFYIKPLAERTGYNIVNASTYAILFAVASILIYYLFKKLEVEINEKFVYSSLTFAFWGATLRALVDCGKVPFSFFTVSPGGIMTVGLVYIASFIVANQFFEDDYKVLALIGLSLFGFTLPFWRPKSFDAILLSSSVFVLSISPLFLLNGKFYNKFNKLAIASHFLDASTTFIGVGFFGYIEKFPVLGFLHEVTGTPLVVFLLKLGALIPSLYLIDELIEEEELSLLIKFVIISLGIVTGFRGFLQIGALC